MYRVGSLFYAIYFFASFPMFLRIDEDGAEGGGPAAAKRRRWTLGAVALDALAASMLVTLLLDFWRVAFGGIVDGSGGGGGGGGDARAAGLIWAA